MALKKKLIKDTPPMRLAEAQAHKSWEPIPQRAALLHPWKKDLENHIQKLAMTAAHQIDDGFEDDAASTLLKLQCAKTKLAASQTPSVQMKQIRDHLNRTEDDIDHNTTLLHDTKK